MAARKKTTKTKTTRKTSRKTTKKAPAKSRARKTTAKKPEVVSMEKESMSADNSSKKLYWVIGIVVFLVLLYFLRGWLLVGTVNGQPIYRISVINRLEQLGGDRVVDEITRRYVVADELAARGLEVTDEEIESEIDEARQLFEAQGISFEDALAQDNLTLEDVREISRYQRGLRLLAEQEVEEVTDEDVTAYYEENKDALFEDQELEDVKDQLKASLEEQALQQKEQEIIADLLANANIVTFKEY